MDLNIIKEDVIVNEILKPNDGDKTYDCVVCMKANSNAKSKWKLSQKFVETCTEACKERQLICSRDAKKEVWYRRSK